MHTSEVIQNSFSHKWGHTPRAPRLFGSELFRQIDTLAQHPEVIRYKQQLEVQRQADISTPFQGTVSAQEFLSLLQADPQLLSQFSHNFKFDISDLYLGTGERGYFLNSDRFEHQPWQHVHGQDGLEKIVRRSVITVSIGSQAELTPVASLAVHHLGAEYVSDLHGPHRLASVTGYGGISLIELGALVEKLAKPSVVRRPKSVLRLLTLR